MSIKDFLHYPIYLMIFLSYTNGKKFLIIYSHADLLFIFYRLHLVSYQNMKRSDIIEYMKELLQTVRRGLKLYIIQLKYMKIIADLFQHHATSFFHCVLCYRYKLHKTVHLFALFTDTKDDI